MTTKRARFEVDLAAVAKNIRAVRAVAGRRAWVCAALKADAYGFGLREVARAAERAGADAIGAGSIEDGIALRETGITVPILVYGGDVMTQAAVGALESHRLIATVHDAGSLSACARFASSSLEVMVEVDVGLARLGFAPDDAIVAIRKVEASAALNLRGLYTHMRVPERAARGVLRKQFARFRSVVAARPSLIAMAASSRVLDLEPGMRLNAVDVGRAIYGLLPRRGGTLGPRLRPAFVALTSTLATVKPQDGAVSRLGVIPFGRAAGMAAIGTRFVLVAGRRAPVVGTPALEHTRVDLSRHPRARAGDEVVIVGRQKAARISVEDVLHAHPDLPAAGLALAVGASVPRVYRD